MTSSALPPLPACMSCRTPFSLLQREHASARLRGSVGSPPSHSGLMCSMVASVRPSRETTSLVLQWMQRPCQSPNEFARGGSSHLSWPGFQWNVLSVRTIDRTTSALLFALALCGVGCCLAVFSFFAFFRLTLRVYIASTGFCIGSQHLAGVAAT